MVTRPRGTLQGICLFFSQPPALPPLALRAALACVLVTQIFFLIMRGAEEHFLYFNHKKQKIAVIYRSKTNLLSGYVNSLLASSRIANLVLLDPCRFIFSGLGDSTFWTQSQFS